MVYYLFCDQNLVLVRWTLIWCDWVFIPIGLVEKSFVDRYEKRQMLYLVSCSWWNIQNFFFRKSHTCFQLTDDLFSFSFSSFFNFFLFSFFLKFLCYMLKQLVQDGQSNCVNQILRRFLYYNVLMLFPYWLKLSMGTRDMAWLYSEFVWVICCLAEPALKRAHPQICGKDSKICNTSTYQT